jgi:hypothetical protein
MGETCRTHGVAEKTPETLIRKPERERKLERCKSRYKENIKMYHKETKCKDVG